MWQHDDRSAQLQCENAAKKTKDINKSKLKVK